VQLKGTENYVAVEPHADQPSSQAFNKTAEKLSTLLIAGFFAQRFHPKAISKLLLGSCQSSYLDSVPSISMHASMSSFDRTCEPQ